LILKKERANLSMGHFLPSAFSGFFTSESKSKKILCFLAAALSCPCARADSIFTCHNPFTTPSDKTTTALSAGGCELVVPEATVTASASATFSYLNPATPSYLSGAEASTDVFIDGITPIPAGTFFLATAKFSLSESFRISSYSGDGTIEFPFFTLVSIQAPHNDPSPTCGLTLQTITKGCSGTPDSVIVPFSTDETLTLTLFGSLQTTGLFNSDSLFQSDIFAIYPPIIRDTGGVVQKNAGIEIVNVPEPSSLSMMLLSATVFLVCLIFNPRR
jgi:hypothetical protein